jgi:hypothetical protein
MQVKRGNHSAKPPDLPHYYVSAPSERTDQKELTSDKRGENLYLGKDFYPALARH